MPSFYIQLNPNSPFAISFSIIGFVSIIYLSRIKEKTPAIRFFITGMAGYTIGTAAIFTNAIMLWGGIINPIADALAVFSMASMIGFAYYYPQEVRSLEAKLVLGTGSVIALVALGSSLHFIYQVSVKQNFDLAAPILVLILNPLTFITAIVVFIRRTIVLQREKEPEISWLETFRKLYKPQDREVRSLRNFTLSLMIGLIQGVACGLGTAGLLRPALVLSLVDVSLFFMLVAIVYASFDLTEQYPGLIVRLAGLSLVTISAILGFLGIYAGNAAMAQVDNKSIQLVEKIRKDIQNGDLSALPNEILYVIVWPEMEQEAKFFAEDVQLLYKRQPEFEYQTLVEEELKSLTNPLPSGIWHFPMERQFLATERIEPIQLRYGEHPAGSYYQYAGYTFVEGNKKYEIGFSLKEMGEAPHRINLSIVLTIIIGNLIIIIIFPKLFLSNLIQPLDRLLAGVRQVDAGDLNISVPVAHNDEVGFLATSFNTMAATLREELAKRHQVETELLELTSSLEQRILARTRELSVLYDVSETVSQARDSRTLLSESLALTMNALRSSIGMILLQDKNHTEARGFHLVTHQGMPSEWLYDLNPLFIDGGLFDAVIKQGTPLFIPNMADEHRLPLVMQRLKATALLLAPLQSENDTFGILGITRELDEAFDRDEIALLASIADHIGIALQNEHLRQQAQHVIMLEERQRLSRDLHDSVIQSLYGLATLTEAGQIRLKNEQMQAVDHTFDRIGQTARQAIREMRLFIHQLRPPALEEEGLVNALDLRLAAVEGRSDVQVRLYADNDLYIPSPIETAFFHIAQESLNNTLKHASAKEVSVHLYAQEKSIVLEVIDDGCGFDLETVDSGRMGIANMRERTEEIGGVLKITSFSREGTRIKVMVDVEK